MEKWHSNIRSLHMDNSSFSFMGNPSGQNSQAFNMCLMSKEFAQYETLLPKSVGAFF